MEYNFSYFGIGGLILVFVILLLIVIFVNYYRDNDREVSKFYYLIGLLAFISILSISMIILSSYYKIDLFWPKESYTKPIKESTVSLVNKVKSVLKKKEENVSNLDKSNELKLYYTNVTNNTKNYYKDMKKHKNCIFVDFTDGSKVGIDNYKGVIIYNIPITQPLKYKVPEDVRNSININEPIIIGKSVYTSLKDAIDYYINDIVDYAKVNNRKCIFIPIYTKNGVKIPYLGKLQNIKNIDVAINYVIEKMNNTFNKLNNPN